MARILQLGDSILDNGTYVAAGEPDIAAQISAHGHDVEMAAVDGSRAIDVRVPELSFAPVLTVLSVGGNDALEQIGLLADPEELTFAAAITRLHAVR
ncbi:MAG: hypothetical protein AAGA32_14250 [Pseudomonadota bacterium]